MYQVSCKAVPAGVTGSDAAALRTQNEGQEGAAISGTTTTLTNVGCFPSFWSGQDFSAWLDGDYTGRIAVFRTHAYLAKHAALPSLTR